LITHLVVFIIGVLSGASCHYLGTKYTEQRHKKESDIIARKKIAHLKNIMPKLIEEMVADVRNDKTKLVREFVILPNKRTGIGGMSQPRFAYYEDEHDNLKGKIDILEEKSYIIDVTPDNVPIYRMTEEFVDLLLKHGKEKILTP
jgi:hypothetical protein